jgi:ABC-type Fe3+ transport system permease subunit
MNNVLRLSTGDLAARILAEKTHPRHDVIWGVFPPAVLILSAALTVADARSYESARMLALAAVAFLHSPATQVAAVSGLLLEDAGQLSQAAAFSTGIMGVVAASLLVFHGGRRPAGARGISLIR